MTPTARWHVARPTPLGVVETALKIPAVVLGLVILGRAAGNDIEVPSGARLAQWVVMVILSLGLVAAIVDRVRAREIVAMAFVGPNLAAHVGVVLGLMSAPSVLGDFLVPCLGLFLVGDGVKLVAVGTGELRVPRAGPATLAAIVGVYAAGYLAVLLIDGLR